MEQRAENADRIERFDSKEKPEISEITPIADDAEIAERLACLICGLHQDQGIHICDEFICDGCEHEIVHTDVSDAKYPFFIHRMKRLFQVKNA